MPQTNLTTDSDKGPVSENFSMKIDAVFPEGQGLLATGVVGAGAIADGDTVYLTTVQGRRASCRVKLRLNIATQSGAARAETGMMAGLLLPGLRMDELAEGLLLTGGPGPGGEEPEPEAGQEVVLISQV